MLVYMEDVGRHNAVDKIAGWMFKERLGAHDKICDRPRRCGLCCRLCDL
jgi:formate dehydrogenase assembly factor FdhD